MIEIHLKHVGYGSRGPLYDAFHAGMPIAGRAVTPILAAARFLVSQGLKGEAAVFGPNGTLRATGDLEGLAKLTVVENDRVGPRFGKFQPNRRFAEEG